jgi:Zn-dependent oligopeptidase
MVPAGREHLASLVAEKVACLGRDDVHIEPWDVEYYNHRIDKRNDVNHEKIAEYFPLEHTFNSMLEIFGTNLQMQFIPVPRSELTGHVWVN